MFFASVELKYEGAMEAEFNTLNEALDWINNCLTPEFSDHKIIEGRKLNLKPAQFVTKMVVE